MNKEEFEALREGDVVKYDDPHSPLLLEGPITWAEVFGGKAHSIVFADGARLKVIDTEYVKDLVLIRKADR